MKIYFLGICGTAMGNVARLLKSRGYAIAGSDQNVYPPMSDFLEAAGIEVWNPDDIRALEDWSPDVVVIGNSMTRGNSIVEYLLEARRFRFVSLPEIIRELLLENRHTLVVAGTHGKTSTASMAAYLLQKSGMDPGWMVGGVPRALESGCSAGGTDSPFVIEGDEYDSAFFDKRSKFIHYYPRTLILNNLEFDHADIFRDLEDVLRSFAHLIKLVPSAGYILYNGDDSNLERLFPVSWTQCIRVGFGVDNDLVIEEFEDRPEGSVFSLRWKGTSWGGVNWALNGRYNARNGAMAALGAAVSAGCKDPLEFPIEALGSYLGVRRRQEVRYAGSGLVIVEDFGHHPTAVSAVLGALRQQYPEAHLAACFEPRSNTSATSVMQTEWERAFQGADSLWIAPVHRADTISSGNRLDRELIVRRMQDSGSEGRSFDHYDRFKDSLLEAVASRGEQTWIVIFFSNGSFGNIVEEWLGTLSRTSGSGEEG